MKTNLKDMARALRSLFKLSWQSAEMPDHTEWDIAWVSKKARMFPCQHWKSESFPRKVISVKKCKRRLIHFCVETLKLHWKRILCVFKFLVLHIEIV